MNIGIKSGAKGRRSQNFRNSSYTLGVMHTWLEKNQSWNLEILLGYDLWKERKIKMTEWENSVDAQGDSWEPLELRKRGHVKKMKWWRCHLFYCCQWRWVQRRRWHHWLWNSFLLSLSLLSLPQGLNQGSLLELHS